MRAEGVINLAFGSEFSVEAGQKFAHCGDVSFDASLIEIWVSFLSGSTIITIPHEIVLDPVAFSEMIRRESVNVMLLTTAILPVIIKACPNALTTIDTLFTGGEAVNLMTMRTISASRPPR